MPTIISDFQGAFIEDKQVTDGILIAFEMIDSRERMKNSGLAVKVHLQKHLIMLTTISLIIP